ncbi:MAG TPA: penicillin acylase family protein [Fimbriimonadaceae bacterium]|nr:penicillin acylase family protein [Fimbriimonadaceae bacterium]
MLSLLAAVALIQPSIERDRFGVPNIKAATEAEGFFLAGYAVAEDRLWQMENSRRLARGKMSEVFGPAFVGSDREVLLSSYTDSELEAQINNAGRRVRSAFEQYARGVNAYISDATAKGTLPQGYKENGFVPEPWSPLDSAAIGVRMLQLFGRGGAGEIRNWALYQYLQGRANLKGRALDVMDDFAWFNDSRSIPTVSPKDDKVVKPNFNLPARADSEAHLASLPKVGLLELLPGVRLASNEQSTLVAESVAAPHRFGSYAILVSKKRSASGVPLLLSGPQMGHRQPSVVHEMSIETPTYMAVGMDIPGVPGIVVGHTKHLAWGLTSGVADTDDIFYSKLEGESTYRVGDRVLPLEAIERTLRVKGATEQKVTQLRTQFGPIVIKSSNGFLFSRRSSYRGKELEFYRLGFGIVEAKNLEAAFESSRGVPMNFNLFVADKEKIGYRYVGAIPIRAKGADPRFPTPGEPRFEWQGMVSFESMPAVIEPSSGLLANWNNKPASWWPNLDTPAWGSVFRNESLLDSIPPGTLGTDDLERAIWSIARMDSDAKAFLPIVRRSLKDSSSDPRQEAVRQLIVGHDGSAFEGSASAKAWSTFFDALREEVFLGTTGNFISMDNFRLAAQPSVMLAALEGRTRIKYLAGRTVGSVVQAALLKATDRLSGNGQGVNEWSFAPGGIEVKGQPSIPYSNRGTMIQIVELFSTPRGRNIVSPGVAEAGEHSQDQVPLARAWQYKPMKALK